jgi:serine/threonine-protein kinase
VAGRYRVEREIGKGGMARVLLATHEELDLKVAIKVLHSDGSVHGVERLLREARAVARLRSDNVVRVLDTGEDPGCGRFIVMEYVEGRTLADVIAKESPLPLARAIDFARQICAGLSEAHANGIVHRDVKPLNVLVTRSKTGEEQLKVADFGIAKYVSAMPNNLTQSSDFLGSPKYISPEQLHEAQSVDARTDIWSFGVVLFELLTGQLPFDAYTAAGLLTAILTQEPILLRTLRADAPVELEAIVSRCLAKKPADRFASINQVDKALRAAPVPKTEPPRRNTSPATLDPSLDPTLEPHALAALDEARAPGRAEPGQQPASKGRTAGRIVAVGAGLVLAAGIAAAWPRSHVPPAAEAASLPAPSIATGRAPEGSPEGSAFAKTETPSGPSTAARVPAPSTSSAGRTTTATQETAQATNGDPSKTPRATRGPSPLSPTPPPNVTMAGTSPAPTMPPAQSASATAPVAQAPPSPAFVELGPRK